MAEQPFGVAILGLGNIGSAVARAIAHEADALERASGVRLRLVGVLDRGGERAARAALDASLVTTDGAALVDDPGVQVVVEVLGREQPAADLMRRALAGGKHVVTAN